MKKIISWYSVILLFLSYSLFILLSCGEGEKHVARDDISILDQSPPLKEVSTDILKLLVWGGYAPEDFITDFEKEIEEKYNRSVRLEVTYAASSDDFYKEIRNKNCDLITISHHSIMDERFGYISKNLLLPINLENIPNFRDMAPQFKDLASNSLGEDIYGIPVANGPYGLGFNDNLFETVPDSWSIFWDPRYKDRYSLGAHEYLYNVNITALALGYPIEEISSFDALNNNVFKAKLRELALNAQSFWIGVDTVEDLTGLALGTSWGDSFSQLNRLGEAWKMAQPVEGTMWWIDAYCLTWALDGKPFKKLIAEEWINKSLSHEYQIENHIRELQIYPVIVNIEDELTEEERMKVFPVVSGNSGLNRILQHSYPERDRNGIKLLWDQAMKDIDIERGKD